LAAGLKRLNALNLIKFQISRLKSQALQSLNTFKLLKSTKERASLVKLTPLFY